MKITETEIFVGAMSPFRAVHMSDTHFTLADERDEERKRGQAGRRRVHFPHSEETCELGCRTARELGCPILHTGDFIDSISEANLDAVRRFTHENDVFYAAGNHDFCLYVGEGDENAEYRNISLARVQSCHRNDIRMSSRIINGVNFVALDDGYFRFEAEQTEFLKREAEKGLPIVLLIHKPIYDPSIFEFSERTHRSGGLVGIPDKILQYWDEEKRREVCPDADTVEAVAYIKSERLIKAIVAGHFHENYEGADENGTPVVLTDCETVRVITFK